MKILMSWCHLTTSQVMRIGDALVLGMEATTFMSPGEYLGRGGGCVGLELGGVGLEVADVIWHIWD